MLLDNITYLLGNSLACPQYENVLFCWVMQQESIIEDVLSRLKRREYRVYLFTLTATSDALIRRILADVKNANREPDVLERSLKRLAMYNSMRTIKIDASLFTPQSA